MSKKYLITLAASVLLVLLLVAVGLSSCSTTEQESEFVFAFASDRTGAGDIYALTQSGEICNLTDNPASDWDPAWDALGKTLAFTSQRAGNSDIWLMDAADVKIKDGTVTPEHNGTPRNLTNHPAWDYSPSWSPSGQSLVFVSERDGDPEIFIQNLEGADALQLTFNQGVDHRPAWSPDGNYIAFAAVRNGVEEIYRIRPDGTDEQLVTPHPVQGTSPTWSPDSQQLAFIGWDEENRAGIYTVGPELESLTQLYQSGSWLGSLNWSADGRWLTFTAWESGNHELYALPVEGGLPVQLTINSAWDDFLVINPAIKFQTDSPAPLEQISSDEIVPPVVANVADQDFALGVNIADLSMAYLVNDLGFKWAKGYVNWATVEPEPGQLNWIDPDNVVKAFDDQQLSILMRIHGTPAWARPSESPLSYPPPNLEEFEVFVTELANRYKGKVAAYEIWNEPNLNYEWGNLEPNPVTYTEMLKTAYKAIKKVDPNALIVTGGLATTGNGSATAYGDLTFLQAMYDAGAKDYFDVFGSHPYGYGQPPDTSHVDGLSFDRVAAQHAVMAANGDGDTPIWITEAGWVLQTHWDLGEHAAIGVTEAQQAEYLVRAYQKTRQEWPFVQAFFLFNLDFSVAPWYQAGEPMRWYAILNPDHTPRPAYTQLHQMERK
jgi:Tol biopolymer transport system component